MRGRRRVRGGAGWSALMMALALALAACGAPGDEQIGGPDDVEDPGNDGHDQLEPPKGRETQGQVLLGVMIDGLGTEGGYHANVVSDAMTADGVSVTLAVAGGAALQVGAHRGADPFFNGMMMRGSNGAPVRLSVSRGGYDVAFYKIEIVNQRGEWINPCVADGGSGEVVPLAGRWQRSGFHEQVPDRISFACAGSVAYKCTLWGYLAGTDDTSIGWRAHQACTRMARGDYCANGVSHTRVGTEIKIYDFVGVSSPPPARFPGVQAWPPDLDRLFFEAAWSDGAHPAKCLSRIRWQSLPTGPLCAGRPGEPPELPDPRDATGAAFCEDLEWPDPGVAPGGALLFNESLYSDLELHVWRNGNDLVSTIRGLSGVPVQQPFPRFGTFVQTARDGMLMRAFPDGADPGNFLEVHAYGKAGDTVIAAEAPADGYEDLGREGYVLRNPAPRSVPFRLYRHAVTMDYMASALDPIAGYVLIKTIGHVMPPELP